MEALFAELAIALDGLDFAAENEAIAELANEQARLESSIAEARARTVEISDDIAAWKGPDAGAIADSLLSGTDALQATKVRPSEEDLRAGRESLRLAIVELQGRVRDVEAKIDAHRQAIRRRVGSELEPLADAFLADAQRAAQSILTNYAALMAAFCIAPFGADTYLRLQGASGGLHGGGKLLPFVDNIDVPQDLLDVLAKLDGKSSALRTRAPASIEAPR